MGVEPFHLSDHTGGLLHDIEDVVRGLRDDQDVAMLKISFGFLLILADAEIAACNMVGHTRAGQQDIPDDMDLQEVGRAADPEGNPCGKADQSPYRSVTAFLI